MRTIEDCPICGQKVDKWIYTNSQQGGSSPIIESLQFKKICPHCSSKWNRKFVGKGSLVTTILALSLCVALGLITGQTMLNSATSLGITAAGDATKIAIIAGTLVALLWMGVCLTVCLRIFTQWQLTAPARLCMLCRAPITINDARFCPQCGTDQVASIQTADVHKLPNIGGKKDTKITFLRDEPPKRCIVCNMAISPSDEVIWCPHCGGTAHRDEFLEWLHVKGECPACGQHVDERELLIVTAGKGH